MGIFDALFGRKPSSGVSSSTAEKNETIQPPSWDPDTGDAKRLVAYGVRVARELREAQVPFSRLRTNYWVVSYDVLEAIWYPSAPGSWARRNGRVRDGWSQGTCLLLFGGGELARAEWFGEVDVKGSSIGVDSEAALSWQQDYRWSSGNLARWRSGGGGLHPEAQEHFKGFFPAARRPLPAWAGTSMQLKRFLEQRTSQVPRYY